MWNAPRTPSTDNNQRQNAKCQKLPKCSETIFNKAEILNKTEQILGVQNDEKFKVCSKLVPTNTDLLVITLYLGPGMVNKVL